MSSVANIQEPASAPDVFATARAEVRSVRGNLRFPPTLHSLATQVSEEVGASFTELLIAGLAYLVRHKPEEAMRYLEVAGEQKINRIREATKTRESRRRAKARPTNQLPLTPASAGG